MNSEQITAFLQEHWYIASVVIGAVILIGAVRNWNWLCDPTGTRDAHRHSRGYPDTIDYAPLENNAEFLIYEGANAVGKGRVLGRTVPYQVKQQRK